VGNVPCMEETQARVIFRYILRKRGGGGEGGGGGAGGCVNGSHR